jgi:hypothetical protein
MSDRDELMKQAEELGLDFPKNIPSEKLSRMVDNALLSEENETTDQSNEEDDELTEEEMKVEKDEKAAMEKAAKEEAEAVAELQKSMKKTEKEDTDRKPSKRMLMRRKIAEARKKAFKTHIVTLTNKDSRENDVMTTVNLSFENQYFGLSKIIPLDVPVELEKALIDIAESTRITLHKDEVVSGKRTGNKVPVSVKKFAISYSRQQTEE